MRRFIALALLAIMTLTILNSCAGTKKDCRGLKHYKQKGGFYL